MSVNKLFKDVGFYGVLDVIQRSIGIILVPLYTRVLSQRNYGNLDLMLVVMSTLIVIVDMQMIPGFLRFYPEQQRKGVGKQFVGTCIIARFSLGLIISVIFIFLGFCGRLEFSFFPSFLSNKKCWMIVAAYIPLLLTYDILLLQTRMLRWKKWFAIGALGYCLLSCFFCLLFTVWFGWGITGVLAGQFLGCAIALGLLVGGLKEEIQLVFDKKAFLELLKYTLPLVPGWWLGFLSAYVSRFFIYGIQGADQSAVFAVCMKLVYAIGLFNASFRMAWQPLAMSYVGDRKGDDFFAKSIRIFMSGGIFVIYGITLLAGPLLTFLTPKSYWDAASYFPYFAVGIIIGELENNLQLGNQISKKTYWISISYAVYFAINLTFLLLLTKRFGIFAAALGLIVSSIARAAIAYISAQRSNFINYDKKSIFLFFLACGCLISIAILRSSGLINISAYFSIIVLTGCIFAWFIFTLSDRHAIKGRIQYFFQEVLIKGKAHP